MPVPFPYPVPYPETPTPTYLLPTAFNGPAGPPVVFSHTTSAGPDDSFFLTGAGLGKSVMLWGPGVGGPGSAVPVTVPLNAPDHLIGTVAQGAPDGLYVGEAGDGTRWSAPFRLNAPQPWWCGPDCAKPGEMVDLVGDELAQRPDRVRAWIYVAGSTSGAWASTGTVSRYRVTFHAPAAAGHYKVWVYGGSGGQYGWGGPVPLDVAASAASAKRTVRPSSLTAAGIRAAMERLGAAGGTVLLGEGTYLLDESLLIPEGVTLQGAGRDATFLQMASSPGTRLFHSDSSGWGQVVGGLQDAGDALAYKINVPAAGDWSAWLRYAADNAAFGLVGMSGHTTLQVDNGPPVVLQNLPNTGSWGNLQWAKTAVLHLSAGAHTIRWTNVKGGGINLDGFVLARKPAWQPPALPDIRNSAELVAWQAEDVASSRTVQAQFPGSNAAVVWLMGNDAGLRNLSVMGSPAVNTGIGIRRLNGAGVLDGALVEGVRVAGVEGTFSGENTAVRVMDGRDIVIQDCDLTARAPLFFEGMTGSRILQNRLHSVTRFGGNAEAAILGRTHALHRNIIENNTVESPDGGGGPTARRLLWFSTGQGSVTDNYIAGNIGRTRFGGVAGTDQNVGETILFETNMRVAYYGHPEGASPEEVTLPAVGPFWPPMEKGGDEAPQDEYYLYVVKGRGLGQVRRVTGREGRTLRLDEPWDVTPDANSLVLEALSFVHNIVVGNDLPDGMSGIQLWIGGYRNIFDSNTIHGERKEGIYLFGAMSTPGPTMANEWNAGIGPLFYNTVEGNRISETEQGIVLGVGDNSKAAAGADWPRALGTVIRHNTMVNSRSSGLEISGGSPLPDDPGDLAVEGTLADFNVVQDAPVGYLAGPRTLGTLFRRDHGYFWNWLPDTPPKAFSTSGAREVTGSDNTVEGRAGGGDGRIGNELDGARREPGTG